MAANPPSLNIPTYRIDLSLPPSQRYENLAREFAPKMQGLTPLFDDVLSSFISWSPLRALVSYLASILLFRVYSAEESAELRGMSESSRVPLHFLVALNVFLDSLLGCTSGGVLVAPKAGKKGGDAAARMMHFRTLDWGMDGLRDLLVVLEFVDSKAEEPENVIATSISYAGFVGVLTGVRADLSLSLNFRPTHHCSTLSLRLHQVLVLFGFRPSIGSVLRKALFSHHPDVDLVPKLATTVTAPCYLVICTPSQATAMEKDLYGPPQTRIRMSEEFAVCTNHDQPQEHGHVDIHDDVHMKEQDEKRAILGMESLLEESVDRMACMKRKWESLRRRTEKKVASSGEEVRIVVREKTLKDWVRAYPVNNESTHFGCILDPATGKIRWLQLGERE